MLQPCCGELCQGRTDAPEAILCARASAGEEPEQLAPLLHRCVDPAAAQRTRAVLAPTSRCRQIATSTAAAFVFN
eukprot:COSAG02_NODE_5576_length_4219_cov_7.224757_1_plen_75_part_00